METFPGRVLHSGDFRNPKQFAGLDVLILGFGISGEDITTMLIKFGAKSVILSYHKKHGSVQQFPEGVSIRPCAMHVSGTMVLFQDGSNAVFDAIILATGYIHHYPHMEDKLRLHLKVPSFLTFCTKVYSLCAMIT